MTKELKKDLNRIYIFYHVAKQESFTKAAKSLRMSRTVVMENVRDLEESFQVQLFTRTTRTFSLTAEGERLLARAEHIYAELNLACIELTNHSREIGGKVTLQFPSVLDTPELHGLLSSYMEKHPAVNLEVVSAERIENMESKKLDLALHVGQLNDGDFYAKKIMEFDSYILASPAYLRKYGTPKDPNELKHHHCLNYRHCLTGDEWLLVDPVTRETTAFPIGLKTTVDSERLLVSLAEAGHGIASALSISCITQLQKGTLIPVLREWTYKIPLYLVHTPKKSMSRTVRDFMDTICEVLPMRFPPSSFV